MLFNSIDYIIFLPIVLIIYYFIPDKFKIIWLLLSSYYFYMNWNPAYGILLFFCTLVTYLCARLLEYYAENTKYSRGCLVVCCVIVLGLLVIFKYLDFGVNILNRIFGKWGGYINWNISIELPVGISFYVLQSLGYIIDVYRKEIKAEKNFLRYGLFISFFPQLVAGPIERSKNLLAQLEKPLKLSWDKTKQGLFLIMWGMFIKLVIADRTSILVDTVYGQVLDYPGFYILVATVFFAIQIYCDFYGYSTIARGTALCFGIKLMDNFKAPYYSKSVKEFWSRWHISLSFWFRDYFYILLGGNRKGTIRKQFNRLLVFAVSGLWHGASFSFVTWGFLNGIYQMISDIKKKIFIRRKKQYNFSIGLLKRILTFVLICFTWIFFRADGTSDAINILKNLRFFNWEILVNGAIFNLGISQEYFRVLLVAIGVLMYIDYRKYREHNILQILIQQEWWFQLIIGLILLFSIFLFGCYGVEYETNQFIYFQF